VPNNFKRGISERVSHYNNGILVFLRSAKWYWQKPLALSADRLITDILHVHWAVFLFYEIHGGESSRESRTEGKEGEGVFRKTLCFVILRFFWQLILCIVELDMIQQLNDAFW